MENRGWILLCAVLIPVLAVKVVAAPQGTDLDSARSVYNNKMALIGVLRESARERAVVEGDLQTLCLILGIGIDVTDRHLSQAPYDPALQTRRSQMASDLETCRKGLEASVSGTNQSR